MDEIEEVVEGIFRFAGITVRTIQHDNNNGLENIFSWVQIKILNFKFYLHLFQPGKKMLDRFVSTSSSLHDLLCFDVQTEKMWC